MSRKKSREVAMELLFEGSIRKESSSEIIEGFLENTEYDTNELDMKYIQTILKGVEENLEYIDEVLQNHLEKWKLSRISKINLAILRMSAYEILFYKEIPFKVSINEALDLAKKYSDNKSASFINGVLDSISKNV